eukprot:TRINITY_DN607_c0_g1_i1.p1 TRINITY_DN607_c0_g1~~TRINITY_DN607_c0_g1_i1.p1  ORF type:complete len:462 (+),score=204.45 TRINITY_DN607_c0_g1_i1:46-1431(+)
MATLRRAVRRIGSAPLREQDPVIYGLLQKELHRQAAGLELIASENFASKHVLEALGSVATNKYAEGLPGARYYGGTEVVDQIENVCRDRALEVYGLDKSKWGVNVQPYSGSVANMGAYAAVMHRGDRFMGLGLPDGGHLTHGFYTPKKKVSVSAEFFEPFPYRLGPDGYVDYDDLERIATTFRPKVIIGGGSAYPREWDYARYRDICDKVGAYFMMDMAHISGLVAAGEAENCFKYADIVTSTTHKTLRGPRSGLVFWNKETVSENVDDAVFPGLQGGPHMHQIAALAAQLKEVATPEFKSYIQQVRRNCTVLGEELARRGHTLCTGGTDNHLLLVDLRPLGLTGSKAQNICDATAITLNKNSVVGDKSAMNPGGIRIGTPALTSRGFKEEDFVKVGELLDRALRLALEIQASSGKKLKDFNVGLANSPKVAELKADVESFALSFPFPGFDKDAIATAGSM